MLAAKPKARAKAEPHAAIEREVGRRMRAMRLQQGATIEEVAARAGMTKGFLSKVERGEKAPAIATLVNIAGALGVRPADLLETEGRAHVSVVRATQRAPLMHYGNTMGYKYLPLICGVGHRHMEPFLCLAPPDPVVRGEGMTHPGEDFIFVLEGKILSTIGGEQYTLGPGDAIYYDCTIPHWGRGLTGSESTILNTNTVWAPMKSGAPQRTNFDNGLNPWRNQWMSGLHNWEQHASLFKVIPLKERVSLRLNIDFFNVFNMPGIPKTPDSATGIINAQTSGNGSRSLQFGLRLNW